VTGAPLAFLIHPALLALGAGLALIPVVIHLLNRRRVKRVRWAAVQWLLAAMRRHQKRLRMENWLILFLRVAAIVLLGLALARPVLTDSSLAGLLDAKRSVYLVLDTSYSTGAKRDARSVADVVKSEAGLVLESLGSQDTVAVVVTNDPRAESSDGVPPWVLVPRAAGEEARARAKEAVAALKTRDTPALWADALRLVRDQMGAEDVNRQVVIVTDLQARDWTGSGPGAPERPGEALTTLVRMGARIRIVNAGGPDADRRNLAVSNLVARTTGDAFVERPVGLAVTVQNHGPLPVEGAQVAVFVDENRSPERRVPVPRLAAASAETGQPGEETVAIDLPAGAFKTAGSHWVRVEVGPSGADPGADVLGLDSVRGFALRARDRIRVAAWARDSVEHRVTLNAEKYLRAIYGVDEEEGDTSGYGPPSLFEFETHGGHYEGHAAFGDLPATLARTERPVDLVVLANAIPRDPSVRDALKEFVRNGGGLLVFAGDQVKEPGEWNEAFHEASGESLLPFPVAAAETVERRAGEAAAFRIDFNRRTGHPLAEPFTNDAAKEWLEANALTWGRVPFVEHAPPAPPASPTPVPGAPGAGASPPGGAVVLRFTDGVPVVVAGVYGLGRTVWVGTSLDDGWFERSLPFFLPVFLEEAALWLTRPEETGRNLLVGGRLEAALPRGARRERFVTPGGAETPGERMPTRGTILRPWVAVDRLGEAGPWRLFYKAEGSGDEAPETVEHFAVNPRPEEGALLAASEEAVRASAGVGADVLFLPTYQDAGKEAEEVREGEVTTHVLWALLLLLLVESFLAWWFGRRRSLAHAEDEPVA
jgi:hypothetical protein